jgi:hypothetical protein
MDELDTRQRALFNDARARIIDALNGLDLPEPLSTLFSQVQPLLELMTDALFADPDTGLRQLDIEFRNRVNLSDLFAPLDQLFMRFINLIQSIPPDDLTNTMNAIRVSLGAGMDALDPHNILGLLRSGYGRLADLGPTNLVGVSFSLPAIKLLFEARTASAPGNVQDDILAVSARFDVVLSAVSPTATGGQMAQLVQQHQSVLESLRTHINALETSSASEKYAQIQRNLDRLVPDFLQQPVPLAHADIIAGVYAMRPSTKARKFEDVFSRILVEFEPLETSLETTINNLLLAIRETLMLVNPLALKDSVEGIYDAIRTKVQVIDPDSLKGAIDAVFAPLESLVDAIKPANIKSVIDAAYINVVSALTINVKEVLDLLVSIINEKLKAIKESLKTLLDAVAATIQSVAEGLEGIITRFDNLIFVEIFGRLRQVIKNLGQSFDKELERVRNAFNQMLGAIPLNGGATAGVSA